MIIPSVYYPSFVTILKIHPHLYTLFSPLYIFFLCLRIKFPSYCLLWDLALSNLSLSVCLSLSLFSPFFLQSYESTHVLPSHLTVLCPKKFLNSYFISTAFNMVNHIVLLYILSLGFCDTKLFSSFYSSHHSSSDSWALLSRASLTLLKALRNPPVGLSSHSK